MQEGYLIIETNAEHPGLVRIRTSEAPPPETGPGPGDPTGPHIRYIARFNDLSAAQMHTHIRLRHRLVDVDAGLYRCDPVTAIAAIQSLALGHRQVFLDPDLAGDEALEKTIAKHHRRHRLADRIWQVVGIFAVLFLLLKILFGF